MPRLSEVDHRLEVDGRWLDYRLCRRKRRSVGFVIDAQGLRVLVPERALLREIEPLIRAHAEWIFRKQAEWQQKEESRPALQAGERIPYYTGPLTVTVDPARQRGYQLDTANGQLILNAKQAFTDALQFALMTEARPLFQARLDHHAARLGVVPPPLRLSSARTRWGSCSSRGVISLNWRLLFFSLPVIDYVVCHELAHLKEMNHSPRFWAVVASLCPDWQGHRDTLKRQAHTLPTF